MSKILLSTVIDQLEKQKDISINPNHVQSAWVIQENEDKSSNTINLKGGLSLAFKQKTKSWEIETIAFYIRSNMDFTDMGNSEASLLLIKNNKLEFKEAHDKY